MNYSIINSGSDGNAIIVEDILLLDCGVSFKKIEPYYKKLKLVFISHCHSDHLNKTTVRLLAKQRPLLRFVVGEYLVKDLMSCGVNPRNIDLLKLGFRIKYKRFVPSTYKVIP